MRGLRSMKLSKETKKLFKVRRRFSWGYVLAPLLALLLLLSYMIYDGSRIRLDSVRISMPTLPKALEGYTILHLSDIHEFTFGEGAQALAEALDGAKPSIAVISGGLTDDEGGAEGFLQALGYLQEQKIPCYYVLGDRDPPYTDYQADGSFGVNELYQRTEALGAIYLDLPVNLYEGDTGLWLLPASSLLLDTQSALTSLDALEQTYLNDETAVAAAGHSLDALLQSIDYRRQNTLAFQAQMELHTQNDLNIFLTHLPAMPGKYQTETTTSIYKDADLILAGHNHGGVRLPLLGCLRVFNEQFPRGGWLPNNALVSGLSNLSGWTQYISPGLGTGSVRWYSQRWFSTPTITLIQLTKSVA